MTFVELKKDEFREFLDKHPLRSYLQTPEMAQLKVDSGWGEYYVGVKEENKILCATMMISYNGKFGKYFNAPRGFLIDFNDFNLLLFFTDNIKKYIKNKGGYILNIEPKILYKERDIDGQIVEDGFDNTNIYNNLLKLGYKHNGFYEHLDLNKQVRWAFILPIKDKSEDEVFAGFKANTRNVIRKSIKYGITTRELTYDELGELTDIVNSSGSRKHFESRTTEYYQKMYSLFHDKGEVKFLVSQIDLKYYISVLNTEINELNIKINELSDSGSNKGKKQEFNSQIDALNSRIKEAEDLLEKFGNTPIMAGAMFMLYGKEIVYLFSGTKSEFMTFKSQFLIQWDIIKYGIKNGYEVHNFYGINGNLKKGDDRYGVYEFKRSFGGNVIEYIGDFDLIVSPIKYKLHKLVEKFKKN